MCTIMIKIMCYDNNECTQAYASESKRRMWPVLKNVRSVETQRRQMQQRRSVATISCGDDSGVESGHSSPYTGQISHSQVKLIKRDQQQNCGLILYSFNNFCYGLNDSTFLISKLKFK